MFIANDISESFDEYYCKSKKTINQNSRNDNDGLDFIELDDFMGCTGYIFFELVEYYFEDYDLVDIIESEYVY